MDRWRQIEQLYHQAIECDESNRAAFLKNACGTDIELRQEVESLLAQGVDDSSFLGPSAMENVATELAKFGSGLGLGARLGAYTILSLLGKGGMGEVYSARDTKLGRDVAIKVLPPSFALDPDRAARFDQEARLLATLNHSNIATIYSIEETAGRVFLVLELVEGETLADRLKRGRISVSETLRIAMQIAEGLEAAHAKGVIHLDLKPANIQITKEGRVKLLDFGLAKVLAETTDGNTLHSAVASAPATGVILGTAAYMSPEQASGEAVDRRADIWAFGCIVYEMLTGRSPFREETVTGTLAKVLEAHVDLQTLPSESPPSMVRLVERCLQRDPRERLQHIGDARLEIRDSRAGGSDVEDRVRTVRTGTAAVWAAALVVIVAVVAFFVARRSMPEASAVTVRSFIGPIPAPSSLAQGTRQLAISSDGTRLAYKSGNQLFVRPMNHAQTVPVGPGSDVAGNPFVTGNPFFSPDGTWLAFFEFYDLKKVHSDNGGAVTSIATFKGRNFGGAWGEDGTIIFSTEGGLFRVSDQGGAPQLLIAPEREGVLLAWPEFMPGGRSLLFTKLAAGSPEAAEIVLLDLKTLKSKVVVLGATCAHYVPAGYLVYATGRGLEAVAFDPDTGAVSSNAVLIPDADVRIAPDNGAVDFAVSRNGTLVQMPPITGPLSQLVWVDLQGGVEVINTVAPDRYGYPRLSPDGKRIAADIIGPNRDIYVMDLERGSRIRVSEGPGENLMPIWSGDSHRLYYASNRGGFHVYSRAADGTGPEELLIDNSDVQMPLWLAPGNRLLFFKGPYEAADIGAISLDHPDRVEWLLRSKYTERGPAVSPDGNWIAYESDESGRNEISVRPYPDVDKSKIAIGPGLHARWSPRGNELYYHSPEGAMMAVPVQSSHEFHAAKPRLLFPDNRYGFSFGAVRYDVAADGRFLMAQAIGETDKSQVMIGVVLNWLQELKVLLRK